MAEAEFDLSQVETLTVRFPRNVLRQMYDLRRGTTNEVTGQFSCTESGTVHNFSIHGGKDKHQVEALDCNGFCYHTHPDRKFSSPPSGADIMVAHETGLKHLLAAQEGLYLYYRLPCRKSPLAKWFDLHTNARRASLDPFLVDLVHNAPKGDAFRGYAQFLRAVLAVDVRLIPWDQALDPKGNGIVIWRQKAQPVAKK